MRRRTCTAALAALATLALPAMAQAQPGGYPSQPIRMIVTFPPGGSADAVVRMLVPRLNETLGQPVIVDNRPGAGGNIGMQLLTKSAPDGYTFGVGAAGALSANKSLYASMPYDPEKDLLPVGMLAAIPFVLAGHPALPAKNLQQLIDMARKSPGQLSVAHGGNGTAMHLSTALLQQMAGTKMTEVPYKGSGPAALDTLSGQVQLSLVDLPASLQQIKAGKLTAYAVTSPARLPQLSDVPTMAEAGLAGYDSTGWFGVVAPMGTPAAAIARMNEALVKALNDPKIQQSMRNLGVEPAPDTPQAFGAYIRSESQKWARVIKQGNIKLD